MSDVYNKPRGGEDEIPRWHRWQDWINLLVGASLFISPWVIGLRASAAAEWNAWVLGLVIAVASTLGLAMPSRKAPQYANVVSGVWLCFAPWLLGFYALASDARWESLILGLAVLVISLSVVSGMEGTDTIHHASA